MPFESNATPTTATNSATYFVNSRLRIPLPDEAVPEGVEGTGAASVRPSGVSGWSEIVIPANLARTVWLVSCAVRRRSAAQLDTAVAITSFANHVRAAQIG